MASRFQGIFLVTGVVMAWGQLGVTSSLGPHSDDPGDTYPVQIATEGHVLQGRISSQAEEGELVSCYVTVNNDDNCDIISLVRVEIIDSDYQRPHVWHPLVEVNQTQDGGQLVLKHPVVEFLNSSLPFGMEFVVVGSQAFFVDKERYLAVRDLSSLQGRTRVHFDILLKDSLAEVPYVSNPVPLEVLIEYPSSPSPSSLLFAGVLILIIVGISLLIPFAVRTKRRHKEGRSWFSCRSSDEEVGRDDLGFSADEVGSQSNVPIATDGKDNLAIILENGNSVHQRSSSDQHTTIQNRLLRSTSSINFQPHCLDPHYNEAYDRPDFSQMKRPRSRKSKGNSKKVKPSTNGGSRTGSNRSSLKVCRLKGRRRSSSGRHSQGSSGCGEVFNIPVDVGGDATSNVTSRKQSRVC